MCDLWARLAEEETAAEKDCCVAQGVSLLTGIHQHQYCFWSLLRILPDFGACQTVGTTSRNDQHAELTTHVNIYLCSVTTHPAPLQEQHDMAAVEDGTTLFHDSGSSLHDHPSADKHVPRDPAAAKCWDIAESDIVICKRPDGSDWLLSSSDSGQVQSHIGPKVLQLCYSVTCIVSGLQLTVSYTAALESMG